MSMTQLAKEIYEKRLALFDKKNEVADLELQKRTMELNTLLSVSEAVNPDGKKSYTNEIQRKKATDDTLSSNIGYQEIVQNIRLSTLSIGREEIVVEYLRNKLRIELAEKSDLKVELKE